MIYRNKVTGAEIISRSVICSPDWVQVEKKADMVAPKVEAPKPEPPKEEPEAVPKKEPKSSKSSAPKKRTKK